jgi:hypothetical protein
MTSRKDAKTQSSGFFLRALAAWREASQSKTNLWLLAFQQKSVWARGAKLGLSVGVLQAIINQGDVWLAHSETIGTVIKTIFSPLVTFAVALVSAAATYVDKLKRKS